jgi:hypothetical protein
VVAANVPASAAEAGADAIRRARRTERNDEGHRKRGALHVTGDGVSRRMSDI